MIGNDFFTGTLFSLLVLMTVYVIGAIRKRFRPRVMPVAEYSLALGDSKEFPTVLLSFKLDSGHTEGPFEFVPAFAYQLSDELCVSAARSVKTITNLRSTIPVIENIGDESA